MSTALPQFDCGKIPRSALRRGRAFFAPARVAFRHQFPRFVGKRWGSFSCNSRYVGRPFRLSL